ncbi:MAG: hypothetical protein C0425_08940 [Chlorobiaceae bacterium]|nr:hypothetical protein [Chlorobiaceae bacterium]MBA4310448.1 hypothetical protein [Chlorobiaceae bacterium]
MNLLQLLNIVLTHRKKIIAISTIASFFYLLLLYFVHPLTYRSVAEILPPESKTPMGLGSLLQNQEIANFLTSVPSGSAQLFGEIITSRTACEIVVNKLELEKFFDVEQKQDAVRKLQTLITADITKEGIIKVSVPVETGFFGRMTAERKITQEKAAEISNAFVEALDEINREKLSSKSKRARIFIEGQLDTTKLKLEKAERDLADFQRTNKTISIPEQVKTSIESAAKLKGEIVSSEINLALLRQNLSENNSVIQSLRSRIEELNNQYNKFETESDNLFLSFKEAPELGLRYASLFREVKILNDVYLLLQQQFYREKIQENRDVPTIEVLDSAIPSPKPESPRVLFSGLLGIIFIFGIVSFGVIISNKNVYNFLKK